MPRKNTKHADFYLGVNKVLNTPGMSFMENPKTFFEIQRTSGMSQYDMFRHIGRKTKESHINRPSDAERSAQRLDSLKEKSAK
jgi:hypothetical protein